MLDQTQGFAKPFTGPPISNRKMIFKDDDMSTFIGNSQSKKYAQMAASGQLKGSKYQSGHHSSTTTPRGTNNSTNMDFTSPNIALIEAQH
jgi:hypothetical protein